ncbi:hypothetical protein GSI_09663 [Ganoderma sinense ZZ0214-1]|uniref:F-box domain-containing protein n=1 Tax=Ganoderma sinense ZZ0214-1 TaxID=1077348 RepID=A0A2G8S3C0_9APHY|nr:hypothetical protein GSI_09663 [Ganoderma sinense ZZ0214-1]
MPGSRMICKVQTTNMGRFRSLPDLNFDILLQIISLLTRADVSSLTRTCRALRAALSAELAREVVTLEGPQLTSFLAFASVKDERDRLFYFRTLVLPGSTYDGSLSSGEQAISMRDVKQAILGIFKLASTNLESLSVLDVDAFSFRPMELKKLLSSLPNLRELELSGLDKKHQTALADTLPHLRTLTLSFLEHETNALPFLKCPHTALQELTLRNGTFNLKDDSQTLSLPTVHTLRAAPATLPSDVDAYTLVFPNVQHLTLDFPRDYCRMDAEFCKRMPRCHPDIEWPSPHTGDQTSGWRAAFLQRPSKKADAWPHLETLRAAGYGAGRLSWAGLTCRVPRLEVCSSRLLNAQLGEVLGELRPRCVVFHPRSFDGPWKGQPCGWGLLLALQGAPFVTRLVVVVCGRVREYVSQGVWLTNFCRYLEKASVSCLLLRLDFEYPPSRERADQLETWRVTMSNIPSLRVLLFQVEDEVVLGWAKKERDRLGLGREWGEMNEGARSKFLASENLCPVSIEPCEQCEMSSE